MVKPTITMKDLDKIDIRVGKIVKVFDITASDKLVGLVVDFGEFQRTILVGMKKNEKIPKQKLKASRHYLSLIWHPS